MLLTTTVGSLPKPDWLAEPEKLWATWRFEGEALARAKERAAAIDLTGKLDRPTGQGNSPTAPGMHLSVGGRDDHVACAGEASVEPGHGGGGARCIDRHRPALLIGHLPLRGPRAA